MAALHILSAQRTGQKRSGGAFLRSDCRRASARRQGALHPPDSGNPAATAWAGAERACQGQAGAAGFVDGQIRQERGRQGVWSDSVKHQPARRLRQAGKAIVITMVPPKASSSRRGQNQGNRQRPVAGSGPAICAVQGRARCPITPECSARRAPAPFLPLRVRAIGAGDGLAGATAGAGGDESVNAK